MDWTGKWCIARFSFCEVYAVSAKDEVAALPRISKDVLLLYNNNGDGSNPLQTSVVSNKL
jgi:hypothetical protein